MFEKFSYIAFRERSEQICQLYQKFIGSFTKISSIAFVSVANKSASCIKNSLQVLQKSVASLLVSVANKSPLLQMKNVQVMIHHGRGPAQRAGVRATKKYVANSHFQVRGIYIAE